MKIPAVVLKKLGFADEAELTRMVASVDLADPDNLEAFECWKKHDGSKAGLERLLEVQGQELEVFEAEED